MKIKVADATEVQIDFLVATIEGYIPSVYFYDAHLQGRHNYSTDLAQGGPIIEREGISTIRADDDYGVDEHGFCNNVRIPVWCATKGQHGTTTSTEHQHHEEMFQICVSEVVYGPTPLIAAMRCWIISKMGEEVEIPDELVSA